jgi:hypothetical protein
LSPPFLRGARGDLSLIVKQQSVTTFDLKLTPMVPQPNLLLLRFFLDDLTAEGAENTEEEKREMNNYDFYDFKL